MSKPRSVSRILQDVGLSDFSKIPPDVLEKARQRGVAVHEICEQIDRGRKISYCDPSLQPYLAAYETFKQENPFEILAMEELKTNEDPPYRGKVDRFIEWERAGAIVKPGKRKCVLEIKTTYDAYPEHQLQTAAYAPMYGDPDRAVVYLKKDGSYRLEWHEDPLDLWAWFGFCHWDEPDAAKELELAAGLRWLKKYGFSVNVE